MVVDKILIDTNAYASFKRGNPESIEIIRYSPFIGLNAVVLGELLAGFAVGNFTYDEHFKTIEGIHIAKSLTDLLHS